MARRRRGRSSVRSGGARLVSRPLILVGGGLFIVGLLGTVLPVASVPVPQTIGIWCLICSNVLLLVGAFSREM